MLQIAATVAEMAGWDRMVGHAVREAANRSIYPTLRQLGYDVILTGVAPWAGAWRSTRRNALCNSR